MDLNFGVTSVETQCSFVIFLPIATAGVIVLRQRETCDKSKALRPHAITLSWSQTCSELEFITPM